MKKLDKRVAIITGGSGSIGKTTAKLFLEQGAYVMLIDLNEEALKTTVLELGSENVKYVVADVSVAAQVEAYVNETVRAFGEIDVFFNNAGIEGVVNSIEDYALYRRRCFHRPRRGSQKSI